MKKIEQSILEIHRRIPVVRTIEDGVQKDLIKSLHTLQKKLSVPPATKKSLNIPIGDVTIDQDYNKDVAPTFQLPTIYVKHIKKIGDEADVSLDYVIDIEDEVWIKSLGGQGIPKDMCKALTFDNFETIINILERYTGLSKEPIPQINASKVVMDELQWTEATTSKLLPLVYSYWLSKRTKYGKPLCRKYWPQVNSSDTNPRQVFRARDKEKYRLRKQQKRNDIEAFRKMQQLRKEFATAKNLLQLILERELLREAEFDIQREVFEQSLYDACLPPLQGSDGTCSPAFETAATSGSLPLTDIGTVESPGLDASKADSNADKPHRRAMPYRHSLKFEELVYPPELFRSGEGAGGKLSNKSTKASGAIKPTDSSAESAGGTENTAGLLKKPMDRKRKRDRDRESQASGADAAVIVYSYDNAGNVVNTDTGAVSGASLARSASAPGQARTGRSSNNQFRAGASTSGSLGLGGGRGTADIVAALQGDAYLSLEGTEPLVDMRTVVSELDGPDYVCQQPWPSFMDSAQAARHQDKQSVAEYIEQLELRTDASGATIAPISHRCRFRVGRGGRLVMDTIPVYDSDEELAPTAVTDEAVSGSMSALAYTHQQRRMRYVYPTSLPYQYPGNAYNLHFPAGLSIVSTHSGVKTNPTLSTAGGAAGQDTRTTSSLVHESARAEDISEGILSDLPLSNSRFALNLLRNNRNSSSNNTAPSASSSSGSAGATAAAATPWMFANSAACLGGALNVQQRNRLVRMPKMPALAPTGRPALHAAKTARLSAILCASDSEDERVFIPKYRRGEEIEKVVGTKSASTEQIKFKYITNIL